MLLSEWTQFAHVPPTGERLVLPAFGTCSASGSANARSRCLIVVLAAPSHSGKRHASAMKTRRDGVAWTGSVLTSAPAFGHPCMGSQANRANNPILTRSRMRCRIRLSPASPPPSKSVPSGLRCLLAGSFGQPHRRCGLGTPPPSSGSAHRGKRKSWFPASRCGSDSSNGRG